MKTKVNHHQSQLHIGQSIAKFGQCLYVLSGLFIVVALAPFAQAATDTWQGNTSTNWSESNWTGGNNPPAAGDSLVFTGAGTAGPSLNNDLAAGLSFAAITFNNGTNFTLAGNPIILGGNIADNAFAYMETINFPMTNSATRTANLINGANLVIGAPIGQSAASGFSVALTSSGNATNLASSTVTLNGSAGSTYSGTTTVGGGLNLNLDFSNLVPPVNLVSSSSALTLSGGTYTVKGNPSGITFQTNGNLSLTATTGSGITLNPNNGAGTALTLGNTWTRNANSTLNVDISAGGTLSANPALNAANSNGILAYATVKDAAGTGFATTNGSGQIVRNLNVTTLPTSGTSPSTNYSTAGNTTMSAANFGVNSLTIDTTSAGGTLDLGGATDIMTNNAILMAGANNFTIQNGQLGASNVEQVIHQMGTGTLTIAGTVGGGTSSLTKNGSGTLILTGASAYSGITAIHQGTVKAGASTIPGASGPLGNGNNTFQMGHGAVLDLNGFNVGVGTVNNAAGISIITNSAATVASFTAGNGNGARNMANTLLCGPVKYVITGSSGTVGMFANNTHTGGTVFTNSGQCRINTAGSFGTGPIYFAGSGSYQNTTTMTISNAVNVTGTGNLWNFQQSGTRATGVNMYGPWTGTGFINLSQGFSAVFKFFNDMSQFQGTLQLQGAGTGGNNNATFAIYSSSPANTYFDGSHTTWNMILGTAAAGVYLQSPMTNSGAVIRLGDLNTTGNTLAGTIDMFNNGGANTTNTFLVGALNANSTFAGNIMDGSQVTSDGTTAGVTAITKEGTGTWTLSGVNTYTGPTTVSNGLLVVNGLSGTVVSVVAPGAFGGSGTVSGPVVLGAGNAGLNLVDNSPATLYVGDGTTGLQLANGNILSFDVGSTADSIAVSGAFTQSGTETINISTATGFGAGTYNLITGAAGINAANFTIGTSLPGYSLALSNPDSSTLALTVTVSAAAAAFWNNHVSTIWNDHSGATYNWDTDASSGINIANVPSIPTDVTFAANGATLFNTTLGADFAIHSLNFTVPNNVTIGGANVLTVDGGINVNYGAGSNTISTAGVVLGVDQAWNVADAANTLTIRAPVSGAHTLTITGSGAVILSGTNSYSGGTRVESPVTLVLANPTNTLADAAPVIVDGGTLNIGANSDTVGAVSLTNGIITGTGGVLSGSSLYAENGTISANLGGAGGLTKGNYGTVLLSGTNSYSGITAITYGVLQLGNDSALGASSGVNVSGGTLDLNGHNVSQPITAIVGTGYLGDALVNNSTPAALTVDWNNGNQSFSIGGSGNIALPSMTGSAAWTVTQDSSGVVTYGGANDNSFMVLVVNNGTAILDKTNNGHVVGGSGTGTADLILNYGVVQIAPGGNGDQLFNNRLITVNGGWLDMNGQSEAVDGINGFGGQVTNSAAAIGTFTLGANGAVSVGTFSGTIDGAVAVTKTGAGAQTLGGMNTYTGNTTISTGTLALTEPASISNSATINIAGGATLDVTGRGDQALNLQANQTLTGSGAINGNLATLPGSTVNPGTSVGTLLVTNNITLGGRLLMELNRTNAQNCDQLVSVTGTITYGGTLSVTNIGPALQAGNTFQLFPSAVTAFSAITLATNDATGSIYTWNNRVAVDGSIQVLTVTSSVNTSPINITATVSGNQLQLSWPTDHTGWRLLVQTNNLAAGVSSNTNDWTTVSGSAGISQTNITINPVLPAEFYRLVYP